MNPSRLDAVFLRQRLSLLRTLQGLVRNASVAEDLLHETWLRVSRALAERPVDHLEPFVFQTARNLALDHLRAQRRHARVMETGLPMHTLYNVAEERGSAEDAANAERLLRRLSTQVAELTPRQQDIFVRNRLHGQPCPAIANELGLSASTVQKELKHIMLMCLHATEHGCE